MEIVSVAADRIRHQHHPRSTPRPGVTPPTPSALRRPHQKRERHRSTQSSVPLLRRQPHLARARRARPRPDRLDANPRLTRSPRTQVGTENATTATVLRGSTHRPPRPKNPITPGPTRTLDRTSHHRRSTAATRLTNPTTTPTTKETSNPGSWNPAASPLREPTAIPTTRKPRSKQPSEAAQASTSAPRKIEASAVRRRVSLLLCWIDSRHQSIPAIRS